MKILYAVQATGNGHFSRAQDVIPELCRHAKLDLLISGGKYGQRKIPLDYPVWKKVKGLAFTFGKNGGIDVWDTWKELDSVKFFKDVYNLPVEDYDLVVNDFDPVTTFACRYRKVPCIGLSHQGAVLSPKSPRPPADYKAAFSMWVMRTAAPDINYGFHYQKYDDNIFTPLVRKQIRNLKTENYGHITVYHPAYSIKKLVKLFNKVNVKWHVFTKFATKVEWIDNVLIHPFDNEAFLQSVRTCHGMLCGGGFETPAEMLFLGKRLLVIPMKLQYEQQCNAEALRQMGVTTLADLNQTSIDTINEWVANGQVVEVNYPDETHEIVDMIVERHAHKNLLMV